MPAKSEIEYPLRIEYISHEQDQKFELDCSRFWSTYGISVDVVHVPSSASVRVVITNGQIDVFGSPERERTGAILVLCCAELLVEGRAETSKTVGEYWRVIPRWRNVLFSTSLRFRELAIAIVTMVLGWVVPGKTGQRQRRDELSLSVEGLPQLSDRQALIARDRVLFEISAPPCQERGRILWIYANSYTDSIAGPYGLEILRETVRQGLISHITNPFFDFLDPLLGLQGLIKSFEPDLVGISVRNFDDALIVDHCIGSQESIDTQDLLADIATIVTALRKFQVPVIIGGAAFSSSPLEILDHLDLQYGLVGDADDGIKMLLQQWPRLGLYGQASFDMFDSIWRSLPGALCRKGSSGHVLPQARRYTLEQPSRVQREIPYLAMNQKKYLPEGVRGGSGCALECRYCLEAVNRKSMKWRDVRQIVDEIEFANAHYGIKYFHLAESEANLPFSHVAELARELIKRSMSDKIKWTAYFNVLPFDVDSLTLLLESGLYRLKFSVDHFENAMLRSYHKNYTEREVLKLLDALPRYDVQVLVGILLGGPGEDNKTLEHAVSRIREYAFERCYVNYNTGLRIYPGTPFHQSLPELDKRNIFGPGIADGGMSPLVYCSPLPPRALARYLEERFLGLQNVARMCRTNAKTESFEGTRRYTAAFFAWLDERSEDAFEILRSIEGIPAFRHPRDLHQLFDH